MMAAVVIVIVTMVVVVIVVLGDQEIGLDVEDAVEIEADGGLEEIADE